MSRLEWGSGRSQIYAMRSEIENALKKGVPVSRIYRECVAAGTFNGKQRTFEVHVSKIRKALKATEDATAQRPENVSPSKKNRSEESGLPSSFRHSPLPSDDQTDW